MARYDKTTLDFIEKVAGAEASEQPKDSRAKSALKAARLAVKVHQAPVETATKSFLRMAAADFLKTAKTPPLKFYEQLNEKFKRAWWDWEPETLWHSLEDGGLAKPSDEVKNLVMALQICVTTDAPFEHWHIFEKVAHAFSQNRVDFGVVQPLELTEAAAAVRVLAAIRPKREFTSEVCGYIASVAKSSGVVYLPPELFPALAQSELEKTSYASNLAKLVAECWQKKSNPSDEVVGHQIEMLKEISEFVKNG